MPHPGKPVHLRQRGWGDRVRLERGNGAAATKATSQNEAIYKGLAIGSLGSATYLYAADFHNAHVDVYSGGSERLQNWGAMPLSIRGFQAPLRAIRDPENLGGQIYVTYARQDADAEDEVAGAGLGYVSVFGTDGSFHGRVASRGDLNAPWGLAWAPSTFGKFAGHLLVGNFGDGRINAFRATSAGWEARGKLKGTNHKPISIDGLWGVGFGQNNGGRRTGRGRSISQRVRTTSPTACSGRSRLQLRNGPIAPRHRRQACHPVAWRRRVRT